MDPIGSARARLAYGAGRALGTAIRLTGRSGGTAFPGMVASKISPDLLDRLARRLPEGVIVVAGTNGKTTTSRMLSDILTRHGLKVAHNRSGSNLVRGIAGAFIEQMPLLGQGPDIGVVETDENAFPDVVRRTRPRVVVLLNLFRDQLDRYGELEAISSLWEPAVSALGPETTLCVNADDPRLARLAEMTAARVITFGMATEGGALPEMPHSADAAYCPVCESRFEYSEIFLSHLGSWSCPVCKIARPPLDLAVTRVEPHGFERQTLSLCGWERGAPLVLDLALPGLYNAYNALAAAAVSRALGVSAGALVTAVSEFQPAFGRLERVQLDGLELILTLAKNPTGFNEVLRMLASTGYSGAVLIGINDLDADGRDVSWLWDVDFEVLADLGLPVIAAGIRGHDLAVRMKYAGLGAALLDASVAGRPWGEVVEHLLAREHPEGRIFVLLTYTAMLQLRRELAGRGVVEQFWEQ